MLLSDIAEGILAVFLEKKFERGKKFLCEGLKALLNLKRFEPNLLKALISVLYNENDKIKDKAKHKELTDLFDPEHIKKLQEGIKQLPDNHFWFARLAKGVSSLEKLRSTISDQVFIEVTKTTASALEKDPEFAASDKDLKIFNSFLDLVSSAVYNPQWAAYIIEPLRSVVYSITLVSPDSKRRIEISHAVSSLDSLKTAEHKAFEKAKNGLPLKDPLVEGFDIDVEEPLGPAL